MLAGASISRTAVRSARRSTRQGFRAFHASRRWNVVKPFLLADIGEGIRECQVIQWFVKPGARVEQFDPICEVQSDKASVEITSRFDGIIKKLYYEPDDMAIVGKPLVDIDIQSEISPEDEALTGSVPAEGAGEKSTTTVTEQAATPAKPETKPQQPPSPPPSAPSKNESSRDVPSGKHATLATPAVRHMTKTLNIDIADIQGSGKDGRVMKEDVQKFAAQRENGARSTPEQTQQEPALPLGEDRTVPLSGIQAQMFRKITESLSIPHFLYTDAIDLTSLSSLRHRLNKHPSHLTSFTPSSDKPPKLTLLPFLIKALSVALTQHPILNTRLDLSNPSKPAITYRAAHNIGVAIDTPSGLIVPVIKSVQEKSILAIAVEITLLSGLARAGKLSTNDLSGGTITVSNIGSIGGGVVAPVIVEGQVAIVGVGRSKKVPRFDDQGGVVAKEEVMMSWSADHRVVDGATVARAAEMVKGLLEDVGAMGLVLR